MKLKYYLRGLGIGIIVAAAIMLAAGAFRGEELTDAQIKKRAAELGMVEESSVLSELNIPAPTVTTEGEESTTVEPDEPAETEVTEVSAEEESLEAEPTEEVKQEPTATPTKAAEPTKAPEPTKTPEPTKAAPEVADNQKYAAITVNRGDGSEIVSRRLKEAGLVEDANAYNSYLCSKGYDRRISTGVHEIPIGADNDAIAKIICSLP